MKTTILALLVAVTPHARAATHRTLKPDDFEILWVSNQSEAIETSARQRADLLLLNVNGPSQAGFQILEDLKAANPGTPLVILAEKDVSATLSSPASAAASPKANQSSNLEAMIAEAENFRASLHRRATEPFVFAAPYHHGGLNE